MHLILLRHGIAAELHETPRRADGRAPTDADRPLTERGRRRLRRTARGLRQLGVRPDRVIHSGLLRARQTAEIVVKGLRIPPMACEESPALAPESEPGEVFRLLAAGGRAQVLCVGHAPNLDRVLALACGIAGRLVTVLGKAGAACLELPDSGRAAGRIVWFLPPKLLRRLGR